MSSTTNSKVILVIGATGAQGVAVIDALLAPDAQGAPSQYTVRALTRDTSGRSAKELAARGVELVQGESDDLEALARAFDGAYGAWVNTNGYAYGEMGEIYSGMRIFEVAKRSHSLRHYVWSNLRHVSKNAGFDPAYRAEHMDAKGRVGEWLQAQESDAGPTGLVWSMVTTGPYMDMLKGALFRPLNIRADGTVVFAAPVAGGQLPLIALKDLGWWARYSFDHRTEVSGKELNITSERVGWDYLVQTYTKVTGRPAIYKRLSLSDWFSLFDPKTLEVPLARERPLGTNLKQNLSCFWRVLRDDIIDKDMEWIRRVHPETYTLERWMREEGYVGTEASLLEHNWSLELDQKNAARLL
ncbi:NAD(P)-binding protein [Mycena amicta]|nr:NAD(P)-binding protein [Mycena amicta]